MTRARATVTPADVGDADEATPTFRLALPRGVAFVVLGAHAGLPLEALVLWTTGRGVALAVPVLAADTFARRLARRWWPAS